MKTSYFLSNSKLSVCAMGCFTSVFLAVGAQTPAPAPAPKPSQPARQSQPAPQQPNNVQQPGNVNPQQPGNVNPQQPGNVNPQQPGNVNPQQPQQPGVAVPQQPGNAAARQQGVVPPGTPGAQPQSPGGTPPNIAGTAQPGAIAQPLPPDQFVGQTALSGLREIRLAQMAQQRSQNPMVQRFAQDILTQQAQSNRRLTALAQSRGFTLPPNDAFDLNQGRFSNNATGNLRDQQIDTDKLIREPQQPDTQAGQNPGQNRLPVRDRTQQNPFAISDQDRQAFTRMQSLSGSEFDQAFMNAIVQDRQQNLQRFQQAAGTMDDQELKRFIGERLPVMEESHGTAMRLNQTIGGAPTSTDKLIRTPQR